MTATVLDILRRKQALDAALKEKQAKQAGAYAQPITIQWTTVAEVKLWELATCSACGASLSAHPVGYYREERDPSGAMRRTAGRVHEMNVPQVTDYLKTEVAFCTRCPDTFFEDN